MNKFTIISTVTICFIAYSIKPLLIPILFLSTLAIDTSDIFLLGIWAVIIFMQMICIVKIFQKNKAWLHVFFVLVYLSVFLSLSDYIIFTLESDDRKLEIFKILEDLLLPSFAAWVVYYSDAKDFFNKAQECKNEQM